MQQLKMYRNMSLPFPSLPLPEGYSLSRFSGDSDIMPWVKLCKNGLLADDAGPEAFDSCMLKQPGLNPSRDIFFLDFNGEHIATITAFPRPDGFADVHMVSVGTDFRGRGLSKYLLSAALSHITVLGCSMALLTTDDWRKAAIKSYVSAGFLPVNYDSDMADRWSALSAELSLPPLPMYNDDGSLSSLTISH